jgi:hypothetical protein
MSSGMVEVDLGHLERVRIAVKEIASRADRDLSLFAEGRDPYLVKEPYVLVRDLAEVVLSLVDDMASEADRHAEVSG